MAWWYFLREFLYRSIRKRTGENNGGVFVSERAALRREAIDVLYFWLGFFTHLYGAALALLFFAHAEDEWLVLLNLLDALQEPYLGGLGVYVVLKEIRKRRYKVESKHLGEYFVTVWMMLLAAATMATLFLPQYSFDATYKLIVTNSLATMIIYIGGLLNRS